MKKFDIPTIEIAKFDSADVVTTSGEFTKETGGQTYDDAVNQLTTKSVDAANIMTFTF